MKAVQSYKRIVNKIKSQEPRAHGESVTLHMLLARLMHSKCAEPVCGKELVSIKKKQILSRHMNLVLVSVNYFPSY